MCPGEASPLELSSILLNLFCPHWATDRLTPKTDWVALFRACWISSREGWMTCAQTLKHSLSTMKNEQVLDRQDHITLSCHLNSNVTFLFYEVVIVMFLPLIWQKVWCISFFLPPLQKVHNAIHRIKQALSIGLNTIGLPNTYPLDSDLSSG